MVYPYAAPTTRHLYGNAWITESKTRNRLMWTRPKVVSGMQDVNIPQVVHDKKPLAMVFSHAESTPTHLNWNAWITKSEIKNRIMWTRPMQDTSQLWVVHDKSLFVMVSSMAVPSPIHVYQNALITESENRNTLMWTRPKAMWGMQDTVWSRVVHQKSLLWMVSSRAVPTLTYLYLHAWITESKTRNRLMWTWPCIGYAGRQHTTSSTLVHDKSASVMVSS